MNFRPKLLVLSLACSAMLLAPMADAKRVGGGRSAGMQRSSIASRPATPPRVTPPPVRTATPPRTPVNSQSFNQARPNTPPPINAQRPLNQPQAMQQNQGSGVGKMLAAGAAGAAAGYLIGNALNSGEEAVNQASNAANQAANQAAQSANQAAQNMSEQGQAMINNAQNAMTQAGAPMMNHQQDNAMLAEPAKKEESGGGFGWLLILALLAGAFFFFRRKKTPAKPFNPGFTPANAAPYSPNNHFNATPSMTPPPMAGSGMPPATPSMPARLPDDTYSDDFLRQATAIFLQLQSMNTPETVEQMRHYMTPELFNALYHDMMASTGGAHFPELNSDVYAPEQNGDELIVSVNFSGLCQDHGESTAAPFAETWHYVKSPRTGNKWLVAGIQQN